MPMFIAPPGRRLCDEYIFIVTILWALAPSDLPPANNKPFGRGGRWNDLSVVSAIILVKLRLIDVV